MPSAKFQCTPRRGLSHKVSLLQTFTTSQIMCGKITRRKPAVSWMTESWRVKFSEFLLHLKHYCTPTPMSATKQADVCMLLVFGSMNCNFPRRPDQKTRSSYNHVWLVWLQFINRKSHTGLPLVRYALRWTSNGVAVVLRYFSEFRICGANYVTTVEYESAEGGGTGGLQIKLQK